MPRKKGYYKTMPEQWLADQREKARERYWKGRRAYLEEYGRPGEKLRVYSTKFGEA